MDEGILCPVCGKYYFSDFLCHDQCMECGWKLNLLQYENHDLSDDINILSVNESKTLYDLLANEKTHDKAVECQERYNQRMFDVHQEYRDARKVRQAFSCEELKARKAKIRIMLMDELKEIKE